MQRRKKIQLQKQNEELMFMARPEKEAEEKKEKPKKEKKSQKERPKSRKKHAKVQVWKLYEAKDSLKRRNEPCPRCGAGTFLAVYKNRKYCGKCHWAQIQNI